MDYQYDAPPKQQQSPQPSQQNIVGVEPKFLDLEKQITVVKSVLIPNPMFKGRIFGRGGETIKAMSQKYRCRLHVFGAGSTTDQAKEQELLATGEEKYQHYSEPLHIKVSGLVIGWL